MPPGSSRASRFADMENTFAKHQALAAPGAVAGDGGYVYKPDETGTAITVLHDPTGQSNGLTLTEGETFDAIRSELQSKGVVPPAAVANFDPVEVQAEPLPPAEGLSQQVSNETLGESPGMPQEGVSPAVSNETLGESPAQAARTEALPRDVGPEAVPSLGESEALPAPAGPEVSELELARRDLQPSAPPIDPDLRRNFDAQSFIDRGTAPKEGRSLSERLANIERALELITGQPSGGAPEA